MSRCSCPPDDFPDIGCPVHGLHGNIAYPPMNRQARKGETAAEAQRRLYLADAVDRVRVEAAGFVWPVRRPELPFRFGQR